MDSQGSQAYSSIQNLYRKTEKNNLTMALNKALFSTQNTDFFLISPQKHFSTEALLMSTHNICFHEEIRKIFCGYPLLSYGSD